jgi:hypothetical protein
MFGVSGFSLNRIPDPNDVDPYHAVLTLTTVADCASFQNVRMANQILVDSMSLQLLNPHTNYHNLCALSDYSELKRSKIKNLNNCESNTC